MTKYDVELQTKAQRIASRIMAKARRANEVIPNSVRRLYDSVWDDPEAETVQDIQDAFDLIGVNSVPMFVDQASLVTAVMAIDPDSLPEKYRTSPVSFTPNADGTITFDTTADYPGATE